MTPETQKEYFSKANFNLHRWQARYYGTPLVDYMRMMASEFSLGGWRGLRRALVVLFENALVDDAVIKVKGIDIEGALNDIRDLRNPLTENVGKSSSSKTIKKHRGDRKHVTDDEHDKILQGLCTNKHGDKQLASVLEIARLTGMRAIEIFNADMMAEYDELFVHGAKKNEKGDRGLDRLFELTPDVCMQLQKHYELLDTVIEDAIKKEESSTGLPSEEAEKYAIQKLKKRLCQRLSRLTKRLWPRRKNRVTLKTYRHQMGSDMKAAQFSPIEIAAHMGHQSVRSQAVYGHPQRGHREPLLRVTDGSMNMVRVREPRPMFENRTSKSKVLQI